ncbi:hypothetical protein ABK040_001083 [Willaertia magna]
MKPEDIPINLAINEANRKYNTTIRTIAECAYIPLPLDPDNPTTSPMIDIFVKRLRYKKNENAKKALYYLSGGPGMASTNYEFIMALMINTLNGEFDLYTVDHRGVGRSGRIGCYSSQAETIGSEGGTLVTVSETPGCAAAFLSRWGESTKLYSSKHAAIDVASIIQLVNVKQQQDTFVYGCSYASVWVTRFLRYLEKENLFSIVKGAIIDSILSTKGKMEMGGMYTLDQWDETQNLIGEYFLGLCNDVNRTKDSYCKEKLLTDNPVQYMKDIFEGVYKNNTCPQFSSAIEKDMLKSVLGSLLMDQYARILIPPILYRLKRCDSELDIPVLMKMKDYFLQMFNDTSSSKVVSLNSYVMQLHIDYSELYNTERTVEEVFNEYNHTIYMGTGASMDFIVRYSISNWPTYDLDPYYMNHTFTSQVPVLLLNGDTDPVTPLWSAIKQKENIGGNLHDLIVVPYAVHGAIINSPTNYSDIPCGVELIGNFILMQNPNVFTMNRSCIDYISFNFSGSPIVNELIFGVDDIYEDAYEATIPDTTVSIYLFVGVEAATVVVGIIMFSTVLYYYIKLRDKNRELELGAEETTPINN